MEIVGIDVDDRADGTGKAGLTWISKTVLNTRHNMNDTETSEGGWEVTSMRAYLKNTIKPLIPESVRNSIVNVTKVSSIKDASGAVSQQSTTDDVWIPSYGEIIDLNTNERTGARYSSRFYKYSSNIKKTLDGTATRWWMRTAYNEKGFYSILSTGRPSSSYTSADSAFTIALGFCTN